MPPANSSGTLWECDHHRCTTVRPEGSDSWETFRIASWLEMGDTVDVKVCSEHIEIGFDICSDPDHPHDYPLGHGGGPCPTVTAQTPGPESYTDSLEAMSNPSEPTMATGSSANASPPTPPGGEDSAMNCHRCGGPPSHRGRATLYDPDEGGSYHPYYCDACWDEGPLQYCPICEESYIDRDWSGRGGGVKVPCSDCSVEDDIPAYECVICEEVGPADEFMVSAHDRVYCPSCQMERVSCSAPYCSERWHPDDPEYDGYCPECFDVSPPPDYPHDHPAQWDEDPDCECRFCRMARGMTVNDMLGEGEPEQCAICNFPGADNGVTFDTIDGTDGLICHACQQVGFEECDNCGGSFPQDGDHLQPVGTPPSTDVICNGCAEDEGYWYCDIRCNRYFPEGDTCNCDGVHGYQYRPEEFQPQILPEEEVDLDRVPLLGIELEVEDPEGLTDRTRGARLLHDLEWAYPVHDGSLAGTSESQGPGTGGEYGFEIVTQPFTWRWFNENFERIHDLLKQIRDTGFRSWDGERCGMHVHISRRPMTEAHQLRFVNFIYGSVNLALCVGQRGYKSRGVQEYASFTNENRAQLLHKIRHNTNPGIRGHYAAVNAEHQEALEGRWFRGTLNPTSFRKNVEFFHAVWFFTDQYGHQSANEANFIRWLFDHPRRGQYRTLCEFLKKNYLHDPEMRRS